MFKAKEGINLGGKVITGSGPTAALTVADVGSGAYSPAYVLPNASAGALGGVKVGANLSIDGNGVLNAGAGGLTPTAIKTSAYNAVVNDLVRINSTGGAFTVTLPSAPADGDKVGVFDIYGMCGTNAVLVAAAGGKTVEGDATGLSVNVNSAYVQLIYNSTGTNWKITQTPSSAGDVSSGLTVSVDSELALFSGTSGKTVKRATTSGLLKGTSGVVSAATAGTDFVAPVGSDAQLTRQMLIDCGMTVVDKGNSGTSTQTYDYTAGSVQTSTATGNHTIATSNWPPTGNLGNILIQLTNGGAYTLTWPTISWIKPDGTTTTSISTYLAALTGRTALQTSGMDQIMLWSRNAGTTIYGKIV